MSTGSGASARGKPFRLSFSESPAGLRHVLNMRATLRIHSIPLSPMSSHPSGYDIIFAGGGTTACVAAGRLAKADPRLKILILEAGPHTKDKPDHIQPARFYRNFHLPGPTFTHHRSEPCEALGGRTIVVQSGRCLGGGSSVNFMVYARASASDYDDWEIEYGNPGWGSKDLIALAKKAENFQENSDPKVHGTSGPIKVSFTTKQNNVGQYFLDAAATYDKKRAYSDDTNDFFNCNAYGRSAVYKDKDSGHRSDVPHHYIYNESFKNLTIMTGQRVLRIVFDDHRAVGVEYMDDIGGRVNGKPITTVSYASRLVVLSAGAFGSPAILERSGIGSASVLKKYDINQLVDLPGVGEGYMDHNLCFPTYFASEDADTLDVIFRGKEDQLSPFTYEWTQTGKGLLSHNSVDAGIRIRPDEDDLKLMPEFEDRWKSYFQHSPDKPVMWIGSLAGYFGSKPATLNGRKSFTIGYFTEYPVSTGRVHIRSGTDAYTPLEFHPGYLTDAADIGVMRWAYKHSRELARRMACYRGEVPSGHPCFPEGSAATVSVSAQPVGSEMSKIIYSPEDNEAIDEYTRQNLGTTWHSCGTCGMKAREKGGVVDSNLNVYGVQNLKVADLSIMPANVGANTYNTALIIGEKAAVIIARDLGIDGVSSRTEADSGVLSPRI